MKRIFSVFTAVVLTLLLIFQNLPMAVYAAEPVECVVYVSESGSDDDGDGSQEHPYATLQKAYARFYEVNGSSGTVEDNRIVISGTVNALGHMNNTNSSAGKGIAATLTGDGNGAVLALSGVVRLYGTTRLSNLTLNASSAATIRARSKELTVDSSVATAEESKQIVLYGGDEGIAFGDTKLNLLGGTFASVYGGSNKQGGNTVSITVGENADIASLYAASNCSAQAVLDYAIQKVSVTVTGGTVEKLYMGGTVGNTGSASNQLTVNQASFAVTGGSIGELYAGGFANNGNGVSTVNAATLEVSGGTITNLYCGGETSKTATVSVGSSSAVNVATIYITGTARSSITGIYGSGKVSANAAGSNTVGESNLIFDNYCKSCGEEKTISAVSGIDFIEARESNVEITTGTDIGCIVLDDNSTVGVSGETLTTSVAANITKQPQSQQINSGEMAELSVEVELPAGTEGDISYQWYQSAKADFSDGSVIDGASSHTYAASPELGTVYYRCFIGLPGRQGVVECVGMYSGTAAVSVVLSQEGVRYVYVSENGTDDGTGSFDSPVKTLAEAYALLDTAGTVESNQIVIMGNIADDGALSTHMLYTKAATIRGFDSNATLQLSSIFRLYADLEVSDIHLAASTATIRCRGFSFTSGENVSTTGTITIFGGDEATASAGNPVIKIQSGTYGTIYGGSNNGSGMTVGNSTIEIMGGEVTTVYAGCNSTTNGSNVTSDTVVESAAIQISGGKVTTLYGGGVTGSAINTHTTTVEKSVITVTGGEVTTLYAGGYSRGSIGGTNTVEESVLNISGGRVGTLYGNGECESGQNEVLQSSVVFLEAGSAGEPMEITSMENVPLLKVLDSFVKMGSVNNISEIIFYDMDSEIRVGDTAISASDIITILAQPQNSTVNFKQAASATVSANLPSQDSEGSVTYQWYLNNASEMIDAQAMENETAATLSFTPPVYGEHEVFCVVSNDGGSACGGIAGKIGCATEIAVITVEPAVIGDVIYYVDCNSNHTIRDGSENSPWASIEEARAYLRENKGGITGNITVIMEEGVYRISETLCFEAEDSGIGSQKITYKAADDAEVVITGTDTISGFTYYTDGIYVAQLPDSIKGNGKFPLFRDLLVNGEKATRARTPNNGWNYFASYQAEPEDGSGFYIYADDVPDLDSWEGVELCYNYEWQLRRIGVEGIEDTQAEEVQLVFREDHWDNYLAYLGKYNISGYGYWLENHLAFLDEAGEWYYDQSSGKLYYYPHEEEVTAGQITATIEYPVVERLITLDGTSEEKVQHLSFQGLTFTGTTSVYATQNGFFEGQGGAESTSEYIFPGAFEMWNANDIVISDCTFQALGNNCLKIREGSHNVQVLDNFFVNSAMGAIWIGDTFERSESQSRYCKNILVENNYIHNIGMDYLGSVGIRATRTLTGLTLKNNTVSYVPYTGISVGYGCSNNVSYDNDINIEGNLVENAMYALSDGAGIYVQGGSPYTEHFLKENVVISNGSSASTRSVGIYLDCGVRNYTVTDNLVLGYKNVVMQVQTISAQMARGHVIKDNYFTLSKQIKGKDNAATAGNTIENNVKYNSTADMPAAAVSIMESAGSSLPFTDSLRVVPEKKHLQLSEDSTALQFDVQVTNSTLNEKTYTLTSYNMPDYIMLNAAPVTVAAGETATVAVLLSLAEDAPASTLAQPVALMATDQWGHTIMRERAISVEVGVNADNIIYRHTPVIDGILDGEYLNSAVALSGTPFYPSAAAQSDVTATVYLLWDETYLYVYAQVSDSTILSRGTVWVDATSTPWANDNLETYFSDSGVESGRKVAVDAFGIACYTVGMERKDYPYATAFTYNGEIIDYNTEETIPAGASVAAANGYVIEMAIPITQGTEDGSIPQIGEEVYFHFQNNDLQSYTSDTDYTVVALKNSAQVYILAGEYPQNQEEETPGGGSPEVESGESESGGEKPGPVLTDNGNSAKPPESMDGPEISDKSASPATGDLYKPWAALCLLLSAGACITVLLQKKKKPDETQAERDGRIPK